MVSKIIFSLNYQIMEKEPVRVWHYFYAMEPENTGNHIEKESTIYFLKPYNHLI